MGAMLGVDTSPSKEFGETALRILDKKVEPSFGNGEAPVIATFAGGCFWGLELAFQRVPGVVKTEVGFTQGTTQNPTYEEVCEGNTGHVEAVQVTYDPTIIPYEELLEFFWDVIDPTTLNKQGNDEGSQYRSGIYYHSDGQKVLALRSRDVLEKTERYRDCKIVTEIAGAKVWYRAEESHQQYLQKGGQCALTGDKTPIRCYGLPYPPRRFDERARMLLQREPSTDITEQEMRFAEESIILAGGQFWGLELALQRLPGVLDTSVGFAQGNEPAEPTYSLVVAGKTNYTEAVRVAYSTAVLPLTDLLDFFWEWIDPTDPEQQGDDAGPHFRTGIYYYAEHQKATIIASRDITQKLYSSPIVTEIEAVNNWCEAEDFFQHYLEKDGQSARKGDLTPIRHYG